MNQTLKEIRPETIALIVSQANAMGVSVDQYLRSLLPDDELELGLKADASNDEFESDMSAFAETFDQPLQYDDTYSREDIYSDHD